MPPVAKLGFSFHMSQLNCTLKLLSIKFLGLVTCKHGSLPLNLRPTGKLRCILVKRTIWQKAALKQGSALAPRTPAFVKSIRNETTGSNLMIHQMRHNEKSR